MDENVLGNSLQFEQGLGHMGLDDLLRLRGSNFLHLYVCLFFDPLKQGLLLRRVKSDTGSRSSCSSSSACPVDVVLDRFGGFKLDNQIHVRNIEPSGSNVRSD